MPPKRPWRGTEGRERLGRARSYAEKCLDLLNRDEAEQPEATLSDSTLSDADEGQAKDLS